MCTGRCLRAPSYPETRTREWRAANSRRHVTIRCVTVRVALLYENRFRHKSDGRPSALTGVATFAPPPGCSLRQRCGLHAGEDKRDDIRWRYLDSSFEFLLSVGQQISRKGGGVNVLYRRLGGPTMNAA